MEVHRSTRLRPREIDVLLQSFGRSHSILQSSFVKHVRGEFGKTGVHAILDLKTDGTIAEENQSFEEGLSQSSASGFLVHDGRSELRMI